MSDDTKVSGPMVSQGKGGAAFERVPTSMKTTACKFWLAGLCPTGPSCPTNTFFLLWLAVYWNSKPTTSWKGDGNFPHFLCLHSSGFANIHKILCPPHFGQYHYGLFELGFYEGPEYLTHCKCGVDGTLHIVTWWTVIGPTHAYC